MYRLVVVEDERDVRQRLITLIKKADSGFQLVAEYENGIDAYDAMATDAPDLLITDIRIPYIDGIELAKRTRNIMPLCKVIIITGYNEFDYAKEAANLGVVSFVSKPVTLESVKESLQKTHDILDQEYVTASNLSKLEAFYRDSLPVIRENDLNRLADMSGIDPDFEKKLAYNKIDLNYEYFAFCIFDLDQTVKGWEERNDLAFASVRSFVEESVRPLYDLELFNRQDKLCLILKSHQPMIVATIERTLEQVILRYTDATMSVGFSNVHQDRNFSHMRREAARALEYRGLMGGRSVFYYGNATLPGEAQLMDEDMIRELGYWIRFHTEEDTLAYLDRIRESMEQNGNLYHYTMMGVLNVLLKNCDHLDRLTENRTGQRNIYQQLMESKTAKEAFGLLSDLCRQIFQINDDLRIDTLERNMQKVIAYIDAHYCDADISFESVAGAVNFSVSYIGALFKKKLGTSFVKHLTALRMERARELLANQTFKIIDVAEQLGYADPYYFSHCFKKHTGVSPKEFRNRAERINENRRRS